MKYLLIKDRRCRILYSFYERRYNSLQSLAQNQKITSTLRVQAYRELGQFPRECSVTRMRNRCTLTGRSRGIYRRFGISRLMFRKLAWQGQLVGVKKAS